MSRLSKKKEIEQLQHKANDSLAYAKNHMRVNITPHTIPIINSSEVMTPPPHAKEKNAKENAAKEKNTAKEKNADKEKNDYDDISVEKLITNLKIISNIKQHEKIYLNEDQIIEIDKSLCPAVSRYFNDRSRNITIKFLKELVHNVLICTDSILTDEQDEIECNTDYNNCTFSTDFTEYNSDILQRFILEINKSFDGLDNLVKTYQYDVTIISEITVLKEKLITRCVKINNILRIKKNK